MFLQSLLHSCCALLSHYTGGVLMLRPTFRQDFDFGPTSRNICIRTHD